MRYVVCLAWAACTSPLPEPYVVKDLRILAVVAEPPEVEAGHPISLSVYLAEPSPGDAPLVRFGRCVDARSFDCVEPEELALGESVADIIAPGVYRAALEMVVPNELPAGENAVVLVHAPGIDALKRIVVGAPGPHNRNPMLDDLYVLGQDDAVGNSQAPLPFVAGYAHRAFPVYAAETLESFVLSEEDGSPFPAVEQASFSWSCAPDCRFDTALSYDFQSVRVTPSGGEALTLFVVMRDGRGGEAFQWLRAPITAR